MDLSKLEIGNAAGDVKTLEQVEALAKAPITHLMVGSITVEERAGNPGETFWVAPDGSYALNARGLPCPGIEYYAEHGARMAAVAHGAEKKLLVSIVSTQSHDDWKRLAECAASFADGVELNISCPNKWKKGKRESLVADDPDTVHRVITDVLMAIHGDSQITVKLPPFENVSSNQKYREIMDVLRGSTKHLDGVTSCNTQGGHPTTINGKQVLGMPQAGLSGPQLKPWSLMQISMLSESLPGTAITGAGGIRSGSDVVDFLSRGASGVQIGTHFFQHGPRVFEEIALELVELDEVAA